MPLKKKADPIYGSCVVVGKLPNGIDLHLCEVDDAEVPDAKLIKAIATRKAGRGRQIIAEVTASYKTPKRIKLEQIEVQPVWRAQKIGTRLYEKLLEHACKKGAVLVSDSMRSPFAEAFWRKQVKKGRAFCANTAEGASAYMGPIRELEALPPDERVAAVENLPMPEGEPGDRKWPCKEFELSCDVTSLDGLSAVWKGLAGLHKKP